MLIEVSIKCCCIVMCQTKCIQCVRTDFFSVIGLTLIFNLLLHHVFCNFIHNNFQVISTDHLLLQIKDLILVEQINPSKTIKLC